MPWPLSPKIAQVAVGLPLKGPFDYFVGKPLRKHIQQGQRVKVIFNHQVRVGYVVGFKEKSFIKKLNPLLSILDKFSPSLDKKALIFCREFSDYYGCSLGEAIETFLPPVLRRMTMLDDASHSAAMDKNKSSSKIILLHDTTLTKRWGWLQDKIKQCLSEGKRVLFLCPELETLKEVSAKISNFFSGKIFVMKNPLTTKKSLEEWQSIRRGEHAIVIGVRSAIFLPVPSLGLVVVYEEDHIGHQQDQTPHFHVRDVALMRFQKEKLTMCFVSSMPSLEIRSLVKKKKGEVVEYSNENLSQFQAIDMTNYNPRKSSLISFPLQTNIKNFLEQKAKIVLIMNKKGFGMKTHCLNCGLVLKCERCSTSLTYLFSTKLLVCRHCHFKMPFPKVCPNCQKFYIRTSGAGIEKVESEVARLYPLAKVGRFDKETDIFDKDRDIVVATQAILKRKEELNVSLIGFLDFDSELNRLDFRCSHKALALLIHLRQLAKEKLIVQTSLPENYVLQAARGMDFSSFYLKEEKLRRELGFPPAKSLVEVMVRGKNEAKTFEQAKKLYTFFKKDLVQGIELFEPQSDIVAKLRDQYRFIIILKSKSRTKVLAFVKGVLKDFQRRSTIITVNVES